LDAYHPTCWWFACEIIKFDIVSDRKSAQLYETVENDELRPELAFASTLLSHWGGAYAALARVAARFAPGGVASVAAVHDRAPQKFTSQTRAVQMLSPEDQWSKLTGILHTSIGLAAATQEKQVSATHQLDLAQYALTTLVDELSAVMTLPGRRSRTATLHMFANGQDSVVDSVYPSGRNQALAA
jgi:hypothetical protein